MLAGQNISPQSAFTYSVWQAGCSTLAAAMGMHKEMDMKSKTIQAGILAAAFAGTMLVAGAQTTTTVTTGTPGNRTTDRTTLHQDGKTSSTDTTVATANGTRTVDSTHVNQNGNDSTRDATTTRNAQGGVDHTVAATGPKGGTVDRSTVTTNAPGDHTRDTSTTATGPGGKTVSKTTDVTHTPGTTTADSTRVGADGKTSTNDVTRTGDKVTDTRTNQAGKTTTRTHRVRR